MRAIVIALALAAAPALAQDAGQTPTTEQGLSQPIVGADGQQIGTAELTGTPNGVLLTATLQPGAVPAGQHAIHFHQTGACDPAQGFESAGGHYNPADAQHGFQVEGGPHAGDMPNFTANADQETRVEIFNPMVTLDGNEAPLLDQDGTAVIIHAQADDYQSQPSGDAGDRLACAAFGAQAQ